MILDGSKQTAARDAQRSGSAHQLRTGVWLVVISIMCALSCSLGHSPDFPSIDGGETTAFGDGDGDGDTTGSPTGSSGGNNASTGGGGDGGAPSKTCLNDDQVGGEGGTICEDQQ